MILRVTLAALAALLLLSTAPVQACDGDKKGGENAPATTDATVDGD